MSASPFFQQKFEAGGPCREPDGARFAHLVLPLSVACSPGRQNPHHVLGKVPGEAAAPGPSSGTGAALPGVSVVLRLAGVHGQPPRQLALSASLAWRGSIAGAALHAPAGKSASSSRGAGDAMVAGTGLRAASR